MHVGPACDDDVDRIAALHVAAWRDAYRGLLPQAYLDELSVDARKAQWTRALADPAIEVLVARHEQTLVGLASYGPSRDDDTDAATMELYAIYVAPRSCRRGIGRRLWQAVRRGVAARNGAAVTLWVLQGNHAAQRFYQAQGFVADGQHKTLTLDGTRLAERRYVWPAARLR